MFEAYLVAACPTRSPAFCAAVPSRLVAREAARPMFEGILETKTQFNFDQISSVRYQPTYLEIALPILDVASLAADPTLSTALAVFLVPSPILEATHGSVSN